LQEYETVWAEVFARFENQREAFNYVLIVIGGAAAAYPTLGSHGPLLVYFYLLAPLVITSLGYIFFDNEIMIWGIVYYTRQHLRPRIQQLTGDDAAVDLEQRRFAYMPAGARSAHRMLSYGRWAVFLMPSLAMVAIAVSHRHDSHASVAAFAALSFLNAIAAAVLIHGMVLAARRHSVWTVAAPASGGTPVPLDQEPGRRVDARTL
jgi:hypothetical protein